MNFFSGRANRFDAAALIGLWLISAFSLFELDTNWDTFFYHLPYAALRAGIVTNATFVLAPELYERFQGFPALIDLIQGWLWKLTGRPEAVHLITPIAITAFALYASRAFAVPILWSVSIFLAVPILNVALDASYVDLWTNAFFSLYLIAAYRFLNQPRLDRTAGIVMMVALALAVNAKEQFFVIGGISYALLAILLVTKFRQAQSRKDIAYGAILYLAALPVIFFAPLKNFIVFGNPLYPEQFGVAGVIFSGPEQPSWALPIHLTHTPQFLRYLLSLVEWNAFGARPRGYTIDQGDVLASVSSFRMGGSLILLPFVALCILVRCWKEIIFTLMQRACLVLFCLLWIVVANFPGSNELRYFSFVEIVILFTAFATLRHLAGVNPIFAGLQSGYRYLVIGSIIFVGVVTGFEHLTPSHFINSDKLIAKLGIRADLQEALKHSDTVCYARPNAYAFLYSQYFNPTISPQPYRVIQEFHPSKCPSGSAIID